MKKKYVEFENFDLESLSRDFQSKKPFNYIAIDTLTMRILKVGINAITIRFKSNGAVIGRTTAMFLLTH